MAASGHYYFVLKDDRSQVKCVLFRTAGRYVRFKPQDGISVLARGNLEVYEARGEYQLLVENLEAQGAGALQIAFEQLKQRLSQEGLFDASRKRRLPKLPTRIGVVTSPAGAAIRDILHVLARRFPGMHIRIYPAQVQGEGAREQIRAGIAHFSSSGWAEVLIVARGGGTLEDLWTFNEESVARAVAACSVPVISAIGHETDFSICDFAADVRAATPSAAAEIVVCTRDSLLQQLADGRLRMMQLIRYRIMTWSRNLNLKGFDRAEAVMQRVIARRVQAFDDCDERLRSRQRELLRDYSRSLLDLTERLQASDLRLKLAKAKAEQAALQQCLNASLMKRMWEARRRLESWDLHLVQISPLAVLQRGYAIVEDAAGHVLRSADDTIPGAELTVLLHKGKMDVSVVNLHRES